MLLTVTANTANSQVVDSDDVLYVLPQWTALTGADDATVQQEVASLRQRLGPEGPYVKVGFTVYINVVMSDWTVDTSSPSAVRTALAGTVARIDATIARARAHGIPLALAPLTAIRNAYDAVQQASEIEDIRNMQWYSDNALASGWWTYSRYARKQRAVQEAYIRELGRVVAERMRLYPETVVAASGDGEVELSSGRAPDFYADYSPFAVAEFRDWIRLAGLYASGSDLAGQGYELGSRYAGDLTPAVDTNLDGHTLNGDFGTSFQTWDLLHFNWSLSDPVLISDTKAIPLAQYSSPFWVKLPGAVAGGFDPPRAQNRGNAWWELWMLFKQQMVWRHNQEFAKWITTSPDHTGYTVPRERWYSYQIPADYLFNATPENPNERFFSSASSWWTADVSPYGSLGITAFNIDFGAGNIVRTLANVAPRILERGLRWGIIEWHPGAPAVEGGAVATSLDLYRSEMALIEQYRPNVIVPFAWTNSVYRIENTGFEIALREMIARIRDQPPGTLAAGRSSLRFAAVKSPSGDLVDVTPAQEIAITFAGASSAWTAVSNQPWLQITNGAATSSGRMTVAVVNPGDVLGGATSLSATITVTPARSANGPVSIPVTVTLTQASSPTAAAFGSVDTPSNGVTVQGAIPVTGWALDDIGVNRVEVWRNCLEAIDRARGACASPAAGLLANYVFLGRAFLLAGARPDVEAANPAYPLAYRAGWGFMLLTNALPHQIRNTSEGGQGSYAVSAFAIDEEGHAALLGTKTITVNNDAATLPFGAIDTPAQGGTIPESAAPFNNANAYPAFGWAMTQAGKCINTTSTAAYKVFIDGVQRPLTPGANWIAGLNRSDLAAAYPGLCNSTDALAVYYINAAALGLTSGLHTISWDVTDSASQTVAGLGTRFFNVILSASDAMASPSSVRLKADTTYVPSTTDASTMSSADASFVVSGFSRPSTSSGRPELVEGRTVMARIGGADAPAESLLPDTSGRRFVQLPAGRRLHLDLGGAVEGGYHQVGDERRALPVGSTLDGDSGTFAWEPPAGFFGSFALVIVAGGERIDVTVTIVDPTRAQSPLAMHVDTPIDGATITGSLTVGGWALDPSATAGSGIDAVHVWAIRRDVPGMTPQFVGAATLNLPRPDVAQAFGAQFHAGGFQLTTVALGPGFYELTVYVHRQGGQWDAARTLRAAVR